MDAGLTNLFCKREHVGREPSLHQFGFIKAGSAGKFCGTTKDRIQAGEHLLIGGNGNGVHGNGHNLFSCWAGLVETETNGAATEIKPAILNNKAEHHVVTFVVMFMKFGRRRDHQCILLPVEAIALDHRIHIF